MNDADGILDIDLNCDAGSGPGIELPGDADIFENTTAQVFLDEEQNDIPLGSQGQPEKTRFRRNAFTASLIDDGASGCAASPRRFDDGIGHVVFDKSN
jgi:hypothetical protein